MSETEPQDERAPAALRYGIPVGGVVLFLGLVVAAAFTGTADWGLSLPIGLIIGGLVVLGVWWVLRQRGVSITAWIDDYWTRD